MYQCQVIVSLSSIYRLFQIIFLHEECEQKTSVEYILNEVRKYLQKHPTFFLKNHQDQQEQDQKENFK